MKRFLLLSLMACWAVIAASGQKRMGEIFFHGELLHAPVDGFVADSLQRTVLPEDSLLAPADSLVADSIGEAVSPADSLRLPADSLRADSVAEAAFPKDSLLVPADSLRADTLVETAVAKDTLRSRKDVIKKTVPKQSALSRRISRIYASYSDTLPKIYTRYFAQADSLYYNDTACLRSIRLDPYYYRLFLPLTYYHAPIRQAFRPEWEPSPLRDLQRSCAAGVLAADTVPADSVSAARQKRRQRYEKLFAARMDSVAFPVEERMVNRMHIVDEQVNDVLLSIYLECPSMVEQTESDVQKYKSYRKTASEKVLPTIRVFDLFTPDPVTEEETNVKKKEISVERPNFWKTGGEGSVQFSQNYISDNWYKGGDSNNSMITQIRLYANYNDQKLIEFDNELQFNLGFITSPSDTVHQYRTNNDLFRISSKLGVKAVARWYYTLSAEFKTQFFSNYETNSDKKKSAFMTPTELNLGVGMDYKLEKEKINLSLLMSPLTYNMKYLMDRDVDPTAFGLKAGRQHLDEFGSRVQVTHTWKIISSITWDSRLSYFTNYKRVEAEWENTINFVLNRYLSTKLFFHARYDDSVAREEGEGYLQFQELLSFGINYKW